VEVRSFVVQNENLVADGMFLGSSLWRAGSVVAAELAATGASVLIIEKSTYFTRAQMSGRLCRVSFPGGSTLYVLWLILFSLWPPLL
jgi:hypothetical protein